MKDEETGYVYAAKTILMTALANSPKTRFKIKREVRIHKALDHPNIVKFFHSFEDDQYVYMLLHECKNKTLKDLLIRRQRLTEFEVKSYTL
jgi:serine/threonine protein kinase